MPKVQLRGVRRLRLREPRRQTRSRCGRSSATASCELEAYPFDLMTQRYGFSTRIHGNWKLAVDSVCEWYHPPTCTAGSSTPTCAKAEKMVPPVDAYHYDLFPPHMLTSVPGPPPLPPLGTGHRRPPRPDQNWVYRLFRAGLFGPDDVPDIGPLPEFLNKGEDPLVGQRPVLAFPEPVASRSGTRGYYITYTYWPEAVDSHIYEIDLYFVTAGQRARPPRPRSSSSTARSSSPCRTSTRSRPHTPALTTRAQRQFHLSDQELLIRQFHRQIRDAVEAHQAGGGPRGSATTGRRCPPASPTSSRSSTSGPSRPRAERYAPRLSKPFDELVEFYDAIARAPRKPSHTSTRSTSTTSPTTRPACCSCSTR